MDGSAVTFQARSEACYFVADVMAEGLREVRVPEGWQGLSFQAHRDGRIIVTDIPKSCFSSSTFGSHRKASTSLRSRAS